MTDTPTEPSQDPADQPGDEPAAPPDDDGPDKQPDLPDPNFAEVLPGGEDAPGSASEPQDQADQEG